MQELIALCCLFFGITLAAQQSDSPYLQVNTEKAIIPLKSSKTNVHIAGTIAHVKLTQTYHNQGSGPIEAKYVFPMSVEAAVHKMEMEVGNRIIKAKIFEKQQARKIYDKAVGEGKRAAKLDQERPNVFQMNVGNIMPDDVVKINIYYTEMLVPVNGEYQFVAPGVAGPRFTGESSRAEEVFHTPYTPQGTNDAFDYDIQLTLNAGMIIQNVSSNTHIINVNYPQASTAEVFLSKSNEHPANRDFILDYNLRGKEIRSGLLLYEHEDEHFFTLMMQPAKEVKQETIPPREYMFVVDVSGSMHGYPLEVSKTLMRNLLCDLKLTDTFNVLLFASSSATFRSNPVEANHDNIEAAIQFLDHNQSGGGTHLLNALKHAYSMPRTDEDSARSMVVITDGYISVEKEAFQLINKNLDKANVFSFGVGSSVNRYLIEGMAKASHSEAFIATSMEEAALVAKDLKTYIHTPLLTQIQVKAQGFDIYDVEPASVPDVFAARPIMVYGKYKGEAKGRLTITGKQGHKRFRKTIDVTEGTLSKQNKALRHLWARKKIAQLDDYHHNFYENVKEEVSKLGLQYNLATQHTSFVAVDETVVNKAGKMKTIEQPLPLPQNVSNLAVGAEAEVAGKSMFKKGFTLTVQLKQINKKKERRLKMWFTTIYSKQLKKKLNSYDKLRVQLDETGTIIKAEGLLNGQWTVIAEMLNDSAKETTTHYPLQEPATLIITP